MTISRGLDKDDLGCVCQREWGWLSSTTACERVCVCVCVCARTRVYEPSPWKRLILGKVEGKRRGDEG